jgi:hypothetical protein
MIGERVLDLPQRDLNVLNSLMTIVQVDHPWCGVRTRWKHRDTPQRFACQSLICLCREFTSVTVSQGNRLVG